MTKKNLDAFKRIYSLGNSSDLDFGQTRKILIVFFLIFLCTV